MKQNEYLKRAVQCKFNYLVLDNNGRYHFYRKKPFNREGRWITNDNRIDCSCYVYEMEFFKNLKENEVVCVNELLGNKYAKGIN